MFARTRLICVSMNFICDNSADVFAIRFQYSVQFHCGILISKRLSSILLYLQPQLEFFVTENPISMSWS